MTLYEIDQSILDCIDLETGEVLDSEKLSSLEMLREQKIESVACWIKNLTSDVTALKAERDTFTKRIESAQRKIESLKNWLTFATNGEKMTTERAVISFRRSVRLEITNANEVPKKYLVKSVTYTPDKELIKDVMKSGTTVKGCTLVQAQNIQIK